MKSLSLINRTVEKRGRTYLENITLEITRGENWVFLGANGSGKTRLGQLISDEWQGKCGFVSFEKEKAVIDRERKEDQSDILNRPDPGRSASQFILEQKDDSGYMNDLARRFRFTGLLDRGLKYLSSGELRKVLIAEELMNRPEMLILDEPFDALDVDSRADLNRLIEELREEGIQLILLLNRFSEVPESFSHMGYLQDKKLIASGKSYDVLQSEELKRLHYFHDGPADALPSSTVKEDSLFSGDILVEMKDVRVAYDGKAVLDGLNWKLIRGEHWKILGPNGVGKSTMLSLISGDNPQAYANDLTLFGMKRGSGETVWDIKKHIGYMSSSLQRDYRVRTTVLLTVISGFHDSIGMYEHYSEAEERAAMEWLKLIRMDHKATASLQSLSFGEQRLILIIRAMVKHPLLLILDEPCQGLDDVNRLMILKLIDIIGRISDTTILYVTHHREDKIDSVKRELHLKFPGK